MKTLKRIGLRGIPMEKQESRLKSTLDSILKRINWQVASAATVFTLGLGLGLGYTMTTKYYHHFETASGRAIEVDERNNSLLGTYDCTIKFTFPQPGEIRRIYDEGCNRTIDAVKLHGVKIELPYNKLSQQDQETSSQIVQKVSYTLSN